MRSSLPGLRDDYAAPGAVPCRAARMGRPSFLAMLLEKYGQHQPLNRQAERFAREGVALSTDPGRSGRCRRLRLCRSTGGSKPCADAARIHGDDTTVPVWRRARPTARLWIYVRDDRPFAGSDPPAALFHYSRDRRGEHPREHLASWQGSCRPMPMAATTSFTLPVVSQHP